MSVSIGKIQSGVWILIRTFQMPIRIRSIGLLVLCSVRVRLRKVQDVDASLLSIHPACVVSVSLTHLKTESLRHRKESERESVEREILNYDAASLIMNVRSKYSQ